MKKKELDPVISALGLIMVFLCGMMMQAVIENNEFSSQKKQLKALKKLVNGQGYDMEVTHFQNMGLVQNGNAQQIFRLKLMNDNDDETLWLMGNNYKKPDVLVVKQSSYGENLEIALFKIKESTEDSYNMEDVMDYVGLKEVLKYAKAIKSNKSLYKQALKIFTTPTAVTKTVRDGLLGW